MNELADNFQTIPYATLIASLILLLIGLVLWAAGRRVLRPAFGAIAFLGGIGAGWAAGLRIDLGVSLWVTALIVAFLFMCIAILAYRAMIATGMALVLTIIAPLAVWGGAELRGGVPGVQGEPAKVASLGPEAESEQSISSPLPIIEDAIDSWWMRENAPEKNNTTDDDPDSHDPASADPLTGPDPISDLLPINPALLGSSGDRVEQAAGYVATVSHWSQSMWERTPPVLRPGMIIAAIVGALTGFLVGTLASSISVSIVTSFGGSLLWMTSSAVFARELGLSDNLYSMLTAPGWLLIWAMSGIIGLSIQWTYQPRRADKQA